MDFVRTAVANFVRHLLDSMFVRERTDSEPELDANAYFVKRITWMHSNAIELVSTTSVPKPPVRGQRPYTMLTHSQ